MMGFLEGGIKGKLPGEDEDEATIGVAGASTESKRAGQNSTKPDEGDEEEDNDDENED
jgi:hypothetical protein